MFQRALLLAASRARMAGTITDSQFLELRDKTKNDPKFLEKAQELATEQAGDLGLAVPSVGAVQDGTTAVAAIDWTGLAAFLQFLIPLLMSLLNPPKP